MQTLSAFLGSRSDFARCDSDMDTHHQLELPPELWLRILHIAIGPVFNPRADEREPFQPTPTGRLGTHVKLTARLLCVCRSWYALLLPTLCRDVQLGKGSIPLPQHVRRIVFPYPSSKEKADPNMIAMAEQLRQCTQVEILCRPFATYITHFPGPPAIPLPSLQRLEWFNLRNSQHPGINSFVDFLLQCPNLQYLLIGSLQLHEWIPDYDVKVSLPSLKTLRLRYERGYVIDDLLANWSLPALTTLILDSPVYHMDFRKFWVGVGRNLIRVELGDDMRFGHHDYLVYCLQGCPMLQDLAYHVCATGLPMETPIHPALRRVRLQVAQRTAHFAESRVGQNLRNHLIAFNDAEMKNLTTFILYGREDWGTLTNGPDWKTLKEKIIMQGREIILQG